MIQPGAYVDQIPPGAVPPTPAAPVLRITPGAGPAADRPTPPGLYVQVASAVSQPEALQAGLELAQRLGSDRPPVIRGVSAVVDGRPLLQLYAGPFADEAAARRFCGLAVPGRPCLLRVFAPAPPAGSSPAPPPKRTRGPTAAGPKV